MAKTTKYQALVKAKKSNCAGRTTAAALTKKKNAYVAHAVKSGKSKAEATAIANRVLKRGCAAVGSTKKRRTKRK